MITSVRNIFRDDFTIHLYYLTFFTSFLDKSTHKFVSENIKNEKRWHVMNIVNILLLYTSTTKGWYWICKKKERKKDNYAVE